LASSFRPETADHHVPDFVGNGGLCVMPGTHEEPRRKRTGYQDVFYSDTPQTAGNSPLTTIKQSCPEPYQKSVYVLSA